MAAILSRPQCVKSTSVLCNKDDTSLALYYHDYVRKRWRATASSGKSKFAMSCDDLSKEAYLIRMT